MNETTVTVDGVTYLQSDTSDTWLAWCVGCGKGFLWRSAQESDSPPHFHSNRCKRTRSQWNGRCPTPLKRRYKTGEEAHAAFREIVARHGVREEPYRCRCGGYHLGNVRALRVTPA